MASTPNAPVPHPWRNYLRLSIRTLIILVLAIGAALGWIVRRAHLQRDAVAAMKKAGAQISYDIYPTAPNFSWTNPVSWKTKIGDYIGIDFVDRIAYVQFFDNVSRDHSARRRASLACVISASLKH